MIDKSIRQHYQEGEKVNPLLKLGEKLTGNVKEKYLPGGKLDIGQVAKTALTNKLTTAATKKLAGTGILSSLGPIGMLIAMFLARKGIGKGKEYLTQKLTEGGVQKIFQTGFGSPEEQRELRKLEKRRANMLKRRDEDKSYSEKNLDIVTRAIAEAKGLDIKNPNDMKNIDKPITEIQIERSITEPPRVIPKTPEVIIPHLGDKTITPNKTVEETAAMEDIIIRPTVVDTAATEDIITPPPKPNPKHVPHQYRGGKGGNGSGGKGSPSDAPGTPFYKGGRVDKPLTGRSRDI